jgi:rare lipoprotein A
MMDKLILRHCNKLLIVMLMLFLASCSTHVSRNDGAPNFHVDESKIGNAVPKPEKLAKYGNMPSYRVFGKRYYTLKSSKNYEAVGVASWYGTKFHERSTSSGEPYNMLAMTAAHTTLPLPTYVEVTNLSNHRKIIVKVNDRGPFVSNRLIDLSYVAAKKLGMMGRGTAPVRIRAINPYTYGSEFEFANNKRVTPRTTARDIGHASRDTQLVYLQAGAFRNRMHAEQLKQRLVIQLEAPVRVAKGKLYRVQIGPLKDVASVNKVTSRLRQLGIKSTKI